MAKKMEAKKAASSVVLEVEEVAAKKKPGRPIGSTNKLTADLKDCKMKAIVLLTECYSPASQARAQVMPHHMFSASSPSTARLF